MKLDVMKLDVMKLMDQIVESQQILRRAIDGVPHHLTHRRPAAGGFAIVEHAWHLSDFEEEGIAVRLRRVMEETNPQLPDFRGDAIAAARKYIDREIGESSARFAAARAANVARLRSARDTDWSRTATQDQVGPVTLESLAKAILLHDLSHANEIVDLLRELNLTVPADLVAFSTTMPRV